MSKTQTRKSNGITERLIRIENWCRNISSDLDMIKVAMKLQQKPPVVRGQPAPRYRDSRDTGGWVWIYHGNIGGEFVRCV